MEIDSFNFNEGIQKKSFNKSSIINYEGSNYIYPYTLYYKKLGDNSVNAIYKRDIKKKLFNIYDISDRVLDMIENMDDNNTLQYLKKDRERKRLKLLKEFDKEETSKIDFGKKFKINISNYKEKLKEEIYSKRKGTKFMYALMELLLNRPRKEKVLNINKKIDYFYSAIKKKNYSSILNKLINRKNNMISQTSKNTKSFREVNIINSNNNKNLPLTKDNAFHKQKKIEYKTSAIRKSNSLSNIKTFSKKYLYEKNKMNKTQGKFIFMKKNLLNKSNELENKSFKDNNSFNNSFNKENLNNLSIDNINEKFGFSLIKKKLTKNNISSRDNLTLNYPDSQRTGFLNKINYLEKNKIKSMLKKFNFNKKKELINNSLNQIYSPGIDFQKNKRSLLLNLQKLSDKAEEISQQITKSFINEYKTNIKEETQNKNKRTIFLIKRSGLKKHINAKMINDKNENYEKISPKDPQQKTKSNFSLFQKNGRFLKRKIFGIENFKHNFSS